MSRSLKAIAIRRFFANRKDRAIVNKAKRSDRGTLHAHFAHAFYLLCGSWRGLLCACTATCAETTARQTRQTMQPTGSWMLRLQPCMLVRRGSPVVVVVA